MKYHGPEGAEEHPTPSLPLLGAKLKFGSYLPSASPFSPSTLSFSRILYVLLVLSLLYHSIHLVAASPSASPPPRRPRAATSSLVDSLRGLCEIYTSCHPRDPVLREDVAGPSLTRRRCSTVKHLSLEGKVLDEPHDCVCYPFPFVPKPPPTSLNRGVIPPRLPAVAAVAIGEGR